MAVTATASADIEAEMKELSIDEPKAVGGKAQRLMATGKPISAESIQVAIAANKPKVSINSGGPKIWYLC